MKLMPDIIKVIDIIIDLTNNKEKVLLFGLKLRNKIYQVYAISVRKN
jgi:hypothetical protein